MKTSRILMSILFAGFLVASASCQKDTAETISPKSNHFSLGFQLCQYQKDFGIGIHFTSPYIIGQMAFRLRGNVQFADPSWAPYGNIHLSFVNRIPVIKQKLFVYGEGGGGIIIANNSVSSSPVYGSGFGLFGVEFNPIPVLGFYFEMGGMGTPARTTTGNPYSNGFILNTAMRFYL
jgi:hypothetical protein